jgi:chemotaxis protein CheX
MEQQLGTNEVVSMVVTATCEVFGTMLNLPLETAPAHQEPVHPATYDGVVALIGVAGPWTGTGRISCTPQFACAMAGALLMTEYAEVDEDVMDAVAEVANMVVGNVKTLLEERVGPLGLSIPTVIFGRSYKTRSAGVLEWTVVPFQCGAEILEVRFNLMKTPEVSHPLLRPEHLHV